MVLGHSTYCAMGSATDLHKLHSGGRWFVHSCQNHVDKQWLTSSAVGSIPS